MDDEVLTPETKAAVWTTTDDFGDVIQFYAEKMGFDKPDILRERRRRAGGGVKTTFGSAKGPASIQHLTDNQIPQSPAGELRSVRVESLLRRCRSFHLTVLISRGDNEDHTHIIAIYDPFTPIKANQE